MMEKLLVGENLHLVATRDLTLKQAERLANCLDSLGIIPASEYQREEPYLGSTILQDHISATLPQNEKDYIGREHFLYFGNAHKPAVISNLVSSFIWPAPKNNSYGTTRITHDQLGLVVRNRDDVGMPEVPKPAIDNVSLLRVNRRLLEKVIQVEGLLRIARNPEVAASSLHQLGKASLRALQGIASNIEGHFATV